MRLDDLHPNPGTHRHKRRVGRGHGSGRGKTAGRGTKGQQARSGGGWNPRFEGGQTPIHLRLPHRRGFKNPFRVEYAIVKLADLDRLFEAGATVERSDLVAAGLVRRDEERPLKLLANGEITKAIHLEELKYTRAALEKLAAAGGSIRGAAAPESGDSTSPSDDH
jgi:large subunit ribosomal protein L15